MRGSRSSNNVKKQEDEEIVVETIINIETYIN